MGILKGIIIAVLVFVMLSAIAYNVFYFMGEIYDYDEPVDVNLTLSVPDVPEDKPYKFDPKPVAKARSGPGYNFYIESVKSDF